MSGTKDNGGGFELKGYVEVHERIKAFYEKHPEGSLQGRYHTTDAGGQTFIVYRAEAYRTADDRRPGIGFAWEPFPGQTPYTKDSELMNAETSAWGRAIAALGFEVHQGIASAAEVRNRSGGSSGPVAPSEKQLDFLARLAKDLGASTSEQDNIRAYASANLTGGKQGSMSKAIDKLKLEKDHSADDRKAAGLFLAKLTDEAEAWTQRAAADVKSADPSEPEPTAAENEQVPF